MNPIESSPYHPIDQVMVREAVEGVAPNFDGIDSAPYTRIHAQVTQEDSAPFEAPYQLLHDTSQRFVRHSSELDLSCHQLNAQPNPSPIILESWIEGEGYWTLGKVQAGIYEALGCMDVHWGDARQQFPMGLTSPSSLDSATVQLLHEFTQALAHHLSLPDDFVRIEWIKNINTGTYYLRRLITGPFEPAMPVDLLNNTPASAIHWIHSRSGIVQSIEGVEDAQALDGVEEVNIQVCVGDRIGHILDCATRDALGYVVATGEDAQSATTRAKKAADLITINTKSMF